MIELGLRPARLAASLAVAVCLIAAACTGNSPGTRKGLTKADDESGQGAGSKPGAAPAAGDGLASGLTHSCVIRSGGVRCWGSNADGQLGDGTQADRSQPASVVGLSDAVELALGRAHSCARRATGTVVCWGANTRGQLGSGNEVASRKPVAVRGLNDAIAIASGDEHSCALRKDASVVCWGANNNGQLGNLTRTSWNEPAPIRGLMDATAIAAGARHSCALRKTGGAICWGANDKGQLGDGSTKGHERPSGVADLAGLVGIAAAGSRSCAYTKQNLYCWGEVEQGSNEGKASPRPRKLAELPGIAELELGPQHGCVRTNAKRVRCWGQNRDGRVGDGSNNSRPVPVSVSVPESESLSAGGRFSCALRSDGKVSCWGDDAGGALGQGDAQAAAPREGAREVLDLRDTTSLASGEQFSCAVRKTGAVVCWGKNDLGQLGDASGDKQRARPMPVSNVDDGVFVTAYGASACAVRRTGAVVCWGKNDAGQLGRPAGAPLVRPTGVPKIDDATAVTLGASHGCALRRSGQVYCWGSDAEGQLGDGGGQRGGQVASLSDVTALGSGRAHTCALRSSGSIYCWGANNQGQIGNGVGAAQLKTPVEYPAAVTKVSDASVIAIAGEHGCARLRSGKAVCWGRNDKAQLGSGTSSNVWTSRVPVRELKNPTTIGSSAFHVCAAVGKRVLCWGDNDAGQGGYPGANAPTPRAGITGLDVASFALGSDHSCARLRSGGVACWGSNQQGQLGDGGRMISATPLEVIGL